MRFIQNFLTSFLGNERISAPGFSGDGRGLKAGMLAGAILGGILGGSSNFEQATPYGDSFCNSSSNNTSSGGVSSQLLAECQWYAEHG